jgi:hypothetical protein
MTFSGVVQAYVFLSLALGVLVFMHWPRNPDGTLIDPEEIRRWMEYRSLREPPRRDPLAFVSAVVMLMACIAYAISAAQFTR